MFRLPRPHGIARFDCTAVTDDSTFFVVWAAGIIRRGGVVPCPVDSDGCSQMTSLLSTVYCVTEFYTDGVARVAGIIQKDGVMPCPVDADGCFTEDVSDFAGK